MIKKLLVIMILITNILFFCSINKVYADDEDEEEIVNEDLKQIVESATTPTDEPIINSRAAVIYDRTTKKVMWGKSENEKRAMASTTKIMTAIVVLENTKFTDIVTVSKKAAGTGGSRLNVQSGDKISVNDLLYGLLMRSRK